MKNRILSALKFAGVMFLIFNFIVVIVVIIRIFFMSFDYRDNKEGIFENKQDVMLVQEYKGIDENVHLPSDNYDVIDPSQGITSSKFYVCKDNIKTYSAPEAREEWAVGTIENGTPISFSSISNSHWVLISVNPTIEYVDMVNVCRNMKP